MITIKVGLFAMVKESIGESELTIELPEGSTGRDVLTHLSQTYPAAAAVLLKSVLAKGEDYFPLKTELHHQDIVVVIPPVSGGIQ